MSRHYDKDACANVFGAFAHYGLTMNWWNKGRIDCDAWAWYILREPAPALRTATPQEIVNGVTRLFDDIKEAWDLDDGELKKNTEKDGEFYEALLRRTELRVSDDASDHESQLYSPDHCKAFQSFLEMFEDLHNNIIDNPAEDIHLRNFEKSLEAWMAAQRWNTASEEILRDRDDTPYYYGDDYF